MYTNKHIHTKKQTHSYLNKQFAVYINTHIHVKNKCINKKRNENTIKTLNIQKG